jgi:glycosyltransferase involved in cell wall biosynthesis
LNDNDFILLSVGRISPIKSVETLIKAVRLLLPELKNLKVVIIGFFSDRFCNEKKLARMHK